MHFSAENTTVFLSPSDWQEADSIEASTLFEAHCTLNQTLESIQDKRLSSCEPVWDNIYCWPEAPGGTNVSELCSIVFSASYPKDAENLQGKAYRTCLGNGSWADGTRTNYEEWAISFEEYERKTNDEKQLVYMVQHILFAGSIISLVSLGISLAIFRFFRGLRCDRVALLIQLMLALVLRSVVFLIITEPFVFERKTNYRDLEVLCKLVILLHLYATVTSVSWMFVQGLYLNSKLTSSSFNDSSRENFVLYYFIGWGLPAVLLLIYFIIMVYNHSSNGSKCWKGYADMPEIWILLGPIVVGLLLNGLFLVYILRVLLNRLRRINNQGFESTQIFAAAKATLVLSPVLGLNNLLLLYNPGGDYEKYNVVLNAVFGSTQGFFVSVVFCFCNKDVQGVIRRFYYRKTANQQPHRIGQGGAESRTHSQLHRIDRHRTSTTAETAV